MFMLLKQCVFSPPVTRDMTLMKRVRERVLGGRGGGGMKRNRPRKGHVENQCRAASDWNQPSFSSFCFSFLASQSVLIPQAAYWASINRSPWRAGTKDGPLGRWGCSCSPCQLLKANTGEKALLRASTASQSPFLRQLGPF